MKNNICINCSSQTTNPKFCSRSCSAKYTNKTHPKRAPEGECVICKKPCRTTRKYCSYECRKTKMNILPKACVLKDITDTSNHKSSAFAKVRSRARTIAKRLKWNSCKNCGYSIHIEIAHINAISSFPENTPLSVINDSLNLIPLCRNCHWEFDHQILSLDEIMAPPEGLEPSS